MQPSPPSLTFILHRDGVDDKLSQVINAFLQATKEITARVRQGALGDILGATTQENIQGETQQKLDVIANDIIKNKLLALTQVRAIASEEEETVVVTNATGVYLVAFDPLDGSSNIDINGQIGSIFTVYAAPDELAADSELQFHQMGKSQLCAGYVLYGGSTQCVISTRGPTRLFTLDAISNDFLLTAEALSIPKETAEFSVNMANQRFWNSSFINYIQDLLQGETGPRHKRYNMRWNASMVGDIHRVLLRGGIFIYPSDNRNPQQPAKLRLLYEANPMAMLIENAGGKAHGETQRILDIKPQALHERVAVIMGSAEEVETCSYYLN